MKTQKVELMSEREQEDISELLEKAGALIQMTTRLKVVRQATLSLTRFSN